MIFCLVLVMFCGVVMIDLFGVLCEFWCFYGFVGVG